jgi:probable phosphoglycerate mutase
MSDVHCPVRVVLTRHAEAEYESDLLGTSGGSLTSLGRAQARELGERLRSEKVAAVVCSELARSVQTAEIAAGVLGLPVRVCEGLQEFAIGDLCGREWDRALFDPTNTSWLAGDLGPGFSGGETGQQVVSRVLTVLDDIADQFRGETVLVVTHGGVVLALWGLIAPGSTQGPQHVDDVPNGASYAFEGDADGWRLG